MHGELESDVEHLKTDVADIKIDIRRLNDGRNHYPHFHVAQRNRRKISAVRIELGAVRVEIANVREQLKDLISSKIT